MNKRRDFIIGVDIGGTNIHAVLFKNGRILKRITILTPKNLKEFLNKLEKTIREIIPQSGKFLGIGCGIAGILDLKKGTVLKSPNLEFLDGFKIKDWMQKKFHCTVKIDNDARCFLRGEYLFGAGRGYENLVGITLGTGVGGGIIIGGKIVYGANGSAGEIGHMIINSEKDLEETTVKQMRKLKFSKMAEKKFEKNLGIGFSNVVNILDPEIIIIGGGAAENIKTFLPKIKAEAIKSIISPKSRKNVKILMGKLGEDAGAIGAAALFNDNQS
jgi:glucokinase